MLTFTTLHVTLFMFFYKRIVVIWCVVGAQYSEYRKTSKV